MSQENHHKIKNISHKKNLIDIYITSIHRNYKMNITRMGHETAFEISPVK